ncbi:NAD(P)H-dependent oxidoreductase [Brachybacterium muris]|uniref:NADPH-dependent FMN reductase n=1 Tax=Brachybacterium muris TaxID=219301 RepID=UPI00223BAB01|nr:NAD(P)H-dependent oxidoreductase [Brachybacterium muris]MCT1653971.1 NAD(P)H-dependent oxidoreductase [Brachybacterium muris]MCT1998517.1 NAD(P)H-dependent oxidoreductase [Brachybacterium muris]
MTKLGVLIASARPNRVGEHVARWVTDTVKERFGDAEHRAEVDLIDLADVTLPAFDGLTSPKADGTKTTDHARAWGGRIAALDALIIVTPEYNGSYPGALKNAIDYLYEEWSGLPVLMVGYGWGAGAGVLELLERLLTRIGADVMGSVGLAFPADLSLEGDVHVGEETTAALHERLEALEAKALTSVA